MQLNFGEVGEEWQFAKSLYLSLVSNYDDNWNSYALAIYTSVFFHYAKKLKIQNTEIFKLTLPHPIVQPWGTSVYNSVFKTSTSI